MSDEARRRKLDHAVERALAEQAGECGIGRWGGPRPGGGGGAATTATSETSGAACPVTLAMHGPRSSTPTVFRSCSAAAASSSESPGCSTRCKDLPAVHTVPSGKERRGGTVPPESAASLPCPSGGETKRRRPESNRWMPSAPALGPARHTRATEDDQLFGGSRGYGPCKPKGGRLGEVQRWQTDL